MIFTGYLISSLNIPEYIISILTMIYTKSSFFAPFSLSIF